MMGVCPFCGGALQSGFVQSGQRICWLTEAQRGAHVPNEQNGEFYLHGSGFWSGSACPAQYCPVCQLILLPQKEDEPL